jgi:hypothetical protein
MQPVVTFASAATAGLAITHAVNEGGKSNAIN